MAKQQELLEYISQHPHCSQKDMTNHFLGSQNSVAHPLHVLQKKGFIQSYRDQSFTRYHLTEKGGEMLAVNL